MSDPIIGLASREPALLLAADEHERLMQLARSTTAQGVVDGQERLLDELYRANIVPPNWMPPGIVRMGSFVEYRDSRSGCVRRVQIVYPDSADIRNGRISVLSPVGTSLIGLAEGQSIICRPPGGTARRITVLRVSQDPFDCHSGAKS